jgi:hypothetical protein
VPDQFDLRGPADGFHRSVGRAGGYARAPPVLLDERHARRGSRATWLPTLLLPTAMPTGYGPCKESAAPDLRWRVAAGTASWGVQLGLMGVQLGFMVIWAGLRDYGCSAGTAGQQREAVHRAPPMIKRSEAAAAVRPGPAAPSRLTALAISAGQTPGPARRPGAAASFRLRIAGPAGPFVLAWSGDGSPVRGCTTTSGDRVPPRTR